MAEISEFEERCKGVHCVDLGESFPTNIYLQKSASIQPRTSSSKFGRKLFNIIHSPPYPQVVVRRVGPQLLGGSGPVSGAPAAQTLVGTRSNGDARKHFRDEACRSHPKWEYATVLLKGLDSSILIGLPVSFQIMQCFFWKLLLPFACLP